MNPAVTAAFQDALAALKAGDFDRAKRLFEAVLAVQPENIAALNLLGVVLTQLSQFAEAEICLRRAIDLQSRSEVTLYNYGLVLKALRRPAEALEAFSQALAINPAVPETWNNRGTVLNDLKRHEEAIKDFDRAVQLDPRHAEAFYNRGKSLSMLRRFPEALSAFASALALKPDFAEAFCGRGNAYWELKRYDDALSDARRALALKPNLAEGWHGNGKALNALKRHDEALAAFDKAAALRPDLAEAWLGRGNVVFEFKRYDDALAAYDRALALKADLADAWLGRGNAYRELGQYDRALAAYGEALVLSPNLAGAQLGCGNVYLGRRQYDDAAAAYERALALEPDLAEAWVARGNVFFEFKRYEDALAAYDRALALQPALADARLGRGNVLFERKQYDAALTAYEHALALKPGLTEAWFGRGNVLVELRRYDDALAAFDSMLASEPEHGANARLFGYGACARLNTKLFMCDWTALETELARFLAVLREQMLPHARDTIFEDRNRNARSGKRAPPAGLARLTGDAGILFASATDFVQDQAACPAPYTHAGRSGGDKIRLAYMSQDFRRHVTGTGVVDMFENHDRTQFELFGLSITEDDGSDVRKRIEKSFDQFHDLSAFGDDAAARHIHELGIDILVEMVPYSQGARPFILAHRPAPIQVNGWSAGYSTGAPYMDYILGDPWLLPLSDQPFFAEKIVHLPHTCFPHDSTQVISQHTPARSDEGLPETGFVFCCFNGSYKITPGFFRVWTNLLRQVPGSVLWLNHNNDFAVANLRREAEQAGIDPKRLVFAAYRDRLEDHLARHRLADLFLDTLPYNAQSTAMDALWAGLPVLTCAGRSYAGRFAMSQLHNIGLSELIAEDVAAYERLALDLARDPQRLQAIRAKLERNRLTAPLFDTRRLCRELEAAYQTMADIWRSGEPPRSFSVEPVEHGPRSGR